MNQNHFNMTGSCVKQHCDKPVYFIVGPWLLEINIICLVFVLRLRDLCIFYSKLFFNFLMQEIYIYILPKSKVLLNGSTYEK